MTLLPEWDFSIVAEPCLQIPSLLWEKELYLCLTPWDLWTDSVKPIKCKTEATHWKSSWPYLPLCAQVLFGVGKLCCVQVRCPLQPLRQAPCATRAEMLQGCSRESREGLTPLKPATLAGRGADQTSPHCLPVPGIAAQSLPSTEHSTPVTAPGTQLTKSSSVFEWIGRNRELFLKCR